MGNKHTPGPWSIDPQFIFTVETRGNKIIAECCDPDGERSVDEDQANARLIASAPELLEALESIEKWISSDWHLSENNADKLSTIRSAIDKARG